MLQAFIEHANLARLNSLKRVRSGGETLTPELVKQFFSRFRALHLELYNIYGPSETASAVTDWQCFPENTKTYIPIGKPSANVCLYVLNQSGQPVPIGVPGELYIGGIQVGTGYLNNPELTTERFININIAGKTARVYKTGDRVKWLENGSLVYLERTDRQIKLRGFRIELGEIEAALRQHDTITQAAVVLHHDPHGNYCLVAYLTQTPHAKPITNHALRAWLKQRLPTYMIPTHLEIIDDLPLTPSSKVDYLRLQTLQTPLDISAEEFIKPRNLDEEQLVNIWSDVLGIAQIGIHDSFFELGGDSLLAIDLFSSIEKITGQYLPLGTLFDAPTIAQQASILQKSRQTIQNTSVVGIHTCGTKPPLFIAPPIGGTALMFRRLAYFLGADQPLYVFQPLGIDGKTTPHTTTEEMATYYIQQMLTIKPTGAYRIGGSCFGAHIAWEMASQLKQQGKEIEALLLLDPGPPANGPQWSAPKRTPILKRAIHYSYYFLKRAIHHSQQGVLIKITLNKIKQMKFRSNNPFDRLVKTHRIAQRSYIASPLSIRALLIQSKQYSIPEYQKKWEALTQKGLDRIIIPDSTHLSLLAENDNDTSQMANHIRHYLQNNL